MKAEIFAFMLVLSPLLWCWHYSVHSAHPCSFWLHREPLVLYWESKWCQHCGRREGQSSLKGRRAVGTVSASCRLIPHGAGNPLWLGIWGTAWAPEEDETPGCSACSEAVVTIYIMAASILHITKFISTELNLISEN